MRFDPKYLFTEQKEIMKKRGSSLTKVKLHKMI